MNDIFDLSPLSLLSSSDAGRFADVRLMNGQVLRGKIRNILAKEARLILDPEPGGATMEYPFASLRSLSFSFPPEARRRRRIPEARKDPCFECP